MDDVNFTYVITLSYRQTSPISPAREISETFNFPICSDPPKIIFAPGHGLHVIWYKKRFIMMHRGVSLGQSPVVDDGSGMGGSALGSGSDKILLWAPGWAGARECLEALIGEAMQYTCGKDKEKTIIFSYARSMCWDRALTKPKRSLESVILPQTLVTEFKKDVRRFLDTSEWYQELGIPYRRSYLLHGPVRFL
jgi:mitochondrial chaperone BCS1